MNRRDFLQHAGAASAGLVLAKPLLTKPADDWRRFEVMTRVEVLKPVGATRVWVPAALVQQTPYQQTLANTFNAPGAKARLVERTDDALGLVAAEFPAGGILKVSLIEKKGCYRVMEHRKQVLRYARVTRASLRMTCLALLSVKKRERRAGG